MRAPSNGPISLTAPGVAPAGRRYRPAAGGHAGSPAGARPPYRAGLSAARPLSAAPYSAAPIRSSRRRPHRRRGSGPRRAIPSTAVGPVAVKPAATLACPIVSVLDRWLADSVQPAAQRWFGARVVEIKQISAYSCRGMNGNSHAHISEHAFGNALDIAAFTLADGRRISVKDGWKGMPEEQGFLRDVQGAACQQFTTVLAPGSNVYHYDHIHVDLMRRASAPPDLPAGGGLRRRSRRARRRPQPLCLARTLRHGIARRQEAVAAQGEQQGQRGRRVRGRVERSSRFPRDRERRTSARLPNPKSAARNCAQIPPASSI